MSNIDFILKSSIFSYFKTDNPIIDGFIMLSIASTSSYLFTKKNNIIKKVKKALSNCFLKKFKYKINLLAYETTGTRRFPSIQSSISYNAINFCIKNIIKCEFHEITENFDSFINNDDIESDILKVRVKVGYDITQSEIFHIEGDIYGLYNIEVFNNDSKENDYHNDTKTYYKKYISLMSNTGINDIDIFIKKCVEIFDNYQENETNKGPFIFTYKGMKDYKPVFEEKYFRSLQKLSDSIFDNKQQIINAIDKFNNEEYYTKHSHITRKLIPLFYGEPGTGKTFAIRLISKELKRNIIIVPLNKIKNLEELNSVFFFNIIHNHKITPDKCIFVVEDLDAMTELLKSRKYQHIDKKEDVASSLLSLLTLDKNKDDTESTIDNSKPSTLTMSDVLNILDGIYTLDNYVIIFSTNHIEQLDPAFLRDQRITHKIEFKNCSRNILKKIIEQWYDVKLSEQDLLKLKDNTLTLANIVTMCDKCDTIEEVIGLL